MKDFLKNVGWAIPIIFYIGVLAFYIVTVASSCNKHTVPEVDDSYYEGYDDGYDDGYDCGHDDGYYEGYDRGHDDGIYDDWYDNIDEIGWYFEDEAVHYAKEQGGWHPEEAWMIIEAYRNNEPFYQDGSPPSKQDYIDAIDTLIYFYDYFYSARYE